jgi:Fe-S oxidoreductase
VTPTREEFLFFAPWEKALFYVLAFASMAYAASVIFARVRVWQQGKPQGAVRSGVWAWVPTVDALKRWWGNVAAYVLAQRKVRSSRPRSGAPMHLLLFYGFLALFIATTLLAVNTYSPFKFHQGQYYLIYEATFDSLGLVFIAGVVWALVRRIWAMQRGRPPLSRDLSDIGMLMLLLWLGVGGYWLEAARISADPKPWDTVSYVGYAWAQWQGPYSPEAYKAVWWVHAIAALGFIAILPHYRIRHALMAIGSTAEAPTEPVGKLRTVTMEEVEATEQVGAKTARDIFRRDLMSYDACMECGRCTEVCPAWNVGKVLNPKEVALGAKDAATGGLALAERISEEALWQCTTCNACVEACPVLIRHVDLIVDVRRNLVSEGKLVGSGAVMLRQLASTGHAWGSRDDREAWMAGLDVPLCRENPEFEWLFWVGCAGATDPAGIRTSQALVRLLKKAEVAFACLGNEEKCTGDPARRVGEEFLFQDYAAGNASVFERYGVKKVVTACPHCFNTLRHEYGEFGPAMHVVHHTQLLQELVTGGRLQPARPKAGSVVLHDPCYLARINEESEAPRALVQGVQDPEFARVKTRCCGAGGGRMWMDEAPDQRPADARMGQLAATGAERVAVACPFCRIMLGSSREAMPMVDVAELVEEANA